MLINHHRIDRQKTGIRIEAFWQNLHPLAALDEDLDGTIGQFEKLQNRSHCPGHIETIGIRVLEIGLGLRHQNDLLVLSHHGFQRLDGFFTTNK